MLGICRGTPITGNACDDGNACTNLDTCSNGVCVGVPTTGNACDDGNACTNPDTCSNGVCVGVPTTGGACDDLSGCTSNDTCHNGFCMGVRASCDDGNACTFDQCNSLSSTTFSCIHSPVKCDDGNPCTVDSCDTTTGCVTAPVSDGTPCTDPNLCMTGDLCTQGRCIGTLVDCSYLCNGKCDPATGGCIGLSCDDRNACTLDSCDAASGLCSHTPLNCDDGNVCTTDYCDVIAGCVHTGDLGLGVADGLVFADPMTLTWNAAAGSMISNTYRGTIPPGGFGRRSPIYDHVCFESGDAQLNGGTLSVDSEDPPLGTAFYYLVDGEDALCEGTLGVASNATQATPLALCPTPPP